MFIGFQPEIVAVPNDWDVLWSEKERNKMSWQDREEFEERLLDILHVQFVKNSEEVGQKYFASNLTNFSESGIEINLNFSDPLLISAGGYADQVSIKMLRSYFL